MDKQESRRIHLDWWGQCRTCAFWTGIRETVTSRGKCTCLGAPFVREDTCASGYCLHWDSFDTETAVEVRDDPDPLPLLKQTYAK